jgi:hypothetical protein
MHEKVSQPMGDLRFYSNKNDFLKLARFLILASKSDFPDIRGLKFKYLGKKQKSKFNSKIEILI